MPSNHPRTSNPLATLRRFVKPRPPAEVCELCGIGLAADHSHLVEPAARSILCACDPCAILFSSREDARFRRVPRDVMELTSLQLTDAQWDELRLPIGLAFFLQSTPAGRVLAIYPSPAGPTESLLPLEAWHALIASNPILATFEPDVEALLVNRIGPTRAHFRVPIDACYKLVGLIRTHWRGLSGGRELWDSVDRFFDDLKAKSQPQPKPQSNWGKGSTNARSQLHG